MPTYPIDLGRSMGESMPTSPMKSDSSEKHYPSLYLDWDGKYDLPDSGTMTVKFEKVSESNSKGKGETKPRQTVTLEIKSIQSVSGGKSKPTKSEDTGDVLDRLKNESEAPKEESDENYKEE